MHSNLSVSNPLKNQPIENPTDTAVSYQNSKLSFDLFTLSSYKVGTGKKYKQYVLTKMGVMLLGNLDANNIKALKL
jgi:phage regulator Rha-like protein